MLAQSQYLCDFIPWMLLFWGTWCLADFSHLRCGESNCFGLFAIADEVTKRSRLGCGKGYCYHRGFSHTNKIFNHTIVSKPSSILFSMVIIKCHISGWTFWNLFRAFEWLVNLVVWSTKTYFATYMLMMYLFFV